MQDRTIINMTIDLEDFFQLKVPAIINNIKGDEPAIWGIMTVHHMIEHLVLPLNFAIGTMPITLMISEEKIPKQLEYLFSTNGMPKNFKPAFLPTDKTIPLVHHSLEESKQYLINTVTIFLETIHKPDFTTKLNPFYGELNKNGWLTFQYKHFAHHFMQFGLM